MKGVDIVEYINEICINDAIIHVLDNSSEKPMLNDYELELNEEIYVFLEKHIKKCFRSEDLKYVVFNKSENIIRKISQQYLCGKTDLITTSKELATELFAITKAKDNFLSCDVIIVTISTEYGPLLGILKMDYTKNFRHDIKLIDTRVNIDIIPQTLGLPSSGQRLQKCAFIKPYDNKNSFDLMVIDNSTKKGSDANDFIIKYLDCQLIKNERDMTKNFLNSTEEWANTNLSNNAEKQEIFRNIIKENLKEKNQININEISEKLFNNEVFERDIDLKENFKTYINELKSEVIPIDSQWVNQKLKKRKLRVDRDIEITLSEEVLKDNSRFEIKKNGDGTITMIIKNISDYREK